MVGQICPCQHSTIDQGRVPGRPLASDAALRQAMDDTCRIGPPSASGASINVGDMHFSALCQHSARGRSFEPSRLVPKLVFRGSWLDGRSSMVANARADALAALHFNVHRCQRRSGQLRSVVDAVTPLLHALTMMPAAEARPRSCINLSATCAEARYLYLGTWPPCRSRNTPAALWNHCSSQNHGSDYNQPVTP